VAGKELSDREDLELGNLAVAEWNRESCSALAPALGAGVKECWMEMDGACLRYLRTVPTFPSFDKLRTGFLAKDARSGAPQAGSGPALILVHGLLGYSFSWRYTMPGLAPYATVYAPDLLGAGFSDRPAGLDHSLRGMARQLLRFIEGLGISSFDLVGTSHGGAVAMMAAAECVSGNSALQLRRLVLVAPVNPFSTHGQWLAPFLGSDLGGALFRLIAARTTFSYSYWHSRMYGDRSRIAPDALKGYMAPLAKPGLFEHALGIVRTWTQDLRELQEALPKLAGVPTLLMWGSKDSAVYASSAEQLAKYFSNSRTIIFPGIGHLPYEECPEEFNRALIEFLTREKLPA
jgi:pimeloyl-ACP methyl ester carboxylesterase